MINYELLLRPVFGKTAWDVRRGAGSSLAFEFGEPRRQIVPEPVIPRKTLPTSQQRRAGHCGEIRGEWHLCICFCNWTYQRNGEELGNTESDGETMRKITADLEGKKLISIRTDENGRTFFQFEESRELTTMPNIKDLQGGERIEQWFFYTPEEKLLVFYTDGNLILWNPRK